MNLLIVLAGKCKWFEALNSQHDNLINLNDIKDSQPDGYLVKLPMYLHYNSHANIILSSHLSTSTGYYEIS